MKPQTIQFNVHRLAARISAKAVLMQAIAFIVLDAAVFFLFKLGIIQITSLTIEQLYFDSYVVAIAAGSGIVAIQIFFLIGTAAAVGSSVRKSLIPLAELLSATEALADATRSPSGRFSPEALKELARALDSINVAHLDSRIPSDVVQEELRPLASAINEMLARIDEAYNAQKRFVSDASHELRTPIAVIQGYANLLLRWGSEDPATLEESISAIKAEADGMKQMVNQLLFLARGDNESMQIDWQAICISDLVKEVVREARVIAEDKENGEKQRSQKIEESIEDGVRAYGDIGLLKQLVRILVDNSIKYSASDGIIRIKLENDGFNNSRLSVSDEGAGIPEDVLPHIFDRFVRADESRTRNAGGAGLGLSIAKWIAERHGGYIEVVSSEGIGSKFTISLPILQLHE